MNSLKSTKEHYQLAVELVVSQAQKDPNIIAAILYGSLSHDQVWEKSDLDLWLITVDNPKNTNFYSLVSNDIFMHPRGILMTLMYCSKEHTSGCTFNNVIGIN